MPEALISSTTSRGPGVGSGNSRSSSLRSPRNTTPFMVDASSRGFEAHSMPGAGRGHRRLSPPAPCVVRSNAAHPDPRRTTVTVYEMRTYTLHVGKMAEAVRLYTEFGYPALQKGGQDRKLIGYFQADTGMINQLVHLWKFTDDADRRAHWASVFANKDFVEGFAVKFRPLVASQEVKLLTAAPWGPHP